MQAIAKTFSSHKKVGVADQGNETELLSAGASTVQASTVQTAVPVAAPAKKTFDVEGGSQGVVSSNPNVEMMLRHGFLRKVYGILSVQLVVTFGIIGVFQTPSMHETLLSCGQRGRVQFGGDPDYPANTCHKEAVGCCIDACTSPSVCANPSDPLTFRPQPTSTLMTMYYSSLAVGFAALIMLVCCAQNARIYPRNYALLGTFTVAEGFMLAAICAFSQAQVILLAAAMTAGITIGLSLFACQTKIDFTGIGGYLFAGLWCLILFGFTISFFHVPGLQKLYLFAGVMIFSLYIVYDTQIMLGGNHKFTIGMDDYVFAALNLYLDIINLFILLLDLLNGGRD